MLGSIRIGNKRKGAEAKPTAGEIIIDGDRANPVLGNPYVLKNHLDPRERAQVIEDYRVMFNRDWANNGPMRQETERLACRVAAGQNIILMCWCVGPPHNFPCHLDLVKARILDLNQEAENQYDMAETAHAEFYRKNHEA